MWQGIPTPKSVVTPHEEVSPGRRFTLQVCSPLHFFVYFCFLFQKMPKNESRVTKSALVSTRRVILIREQSAISHKSRLIFVSIPLANSVGLVAQSLSTREKSFSSTWLNTWGRSGHLVSWKSAVKTPLDKSKERHPRRPHKSTKPREISPKYLFRNWHKTDEAE